MKRRLITEHTHLIGHTQEQVLTASSPRQCSARAHGWAHPALLSLLPNYRVSVEHEHRIINRRGRKWGDKHTCRRYNWTTLATAEQPQSAEVQLPHRWPKAVSHTITGCWLQSPSYKQWPQSHEEKTQQNNPSALASASDTTDNLFLSKRSKIHTDLLGTALQLTGISLFFHQIQWQILKASGVGSR